MALKKHNQTLKDETIREIIQVIVEQAHPAKIILFGSRARGNANPESDLDLLVIEHEPFGPGRSRRKEAARLWRALARFPVSVDLLLYAEQEVEEWKSSANHIMSRAFREGRALYG